MSWRLISWRFANLALAVFWTVMVPISYVLGWLQNVPFVSAISLYANIASHIAGWRADEPDTEVIERLGRIEAVLKELVEAREQ